MSIVEEKLATLRREMRPILKIAMEGLLNKARGAFEEVEQQLTQGLAEVAGERAEGLTEVAQERAKALAEVDARWAELHREIAAMQSHREQQEGRVALNIGGYRFETSVETLRRVPHTFFDAYFSGRYAQDVCDDGSIFVDRDGEHFGHVLEYMRDGVVSVAEPGAYPTIALLRMLKREFGFYCIELCAEETVEPVQPEVAYVIGGRDQEGSTLSSSERYDANSEQFSAASDMEYARNCFGIAVVGGEIYVSGGFSEDRIQSVEKYTPSSDTWSAVAPLPEARWCHEAVAVGGTMYVVGGEMQYEGTTSSTLKYDSMQGTWSEVAPMPEPRSNAAACVVRSDIYVFGGNVEDGQALNSVFKYDTVYNSWRILAPMPQASSENSANVLDDLVYIVGAGVEGCDVLRFDPDTGVWSELAPTLSRRDQGPSFVLNGRHSRRDFDIFEH